MCNSWMIIAFAPDNIFIKPGPGLTRIRSRVTSFIDQLGLIQVNPD